MEGTTKKKVEGNEVGITASVNPTQRQIRPTNLCTNPPAGEEQVISYIAGDLIGKECQDFVNHVSECYYCFKEVVSWRTAQVLAEAESKPAVNTSPLPSNVQTPAASEDEQSEVNYEQQVSALGRSRFTSHSRGFGNGLEPMGQDVQNSIVWSIEMRFQAR